MSYEKTDFTNQPSSCWFEGETSSKINEVGEEPKGFLQQLLALFGL